MIPIGTPAPQWQDLKSEAIALRLSPVLDATSGVWGVEEGVIPEAAFKDDGSGFAGIDTTVTVGLKPTVTPNGFMGMY